MRWLKRIFWWLFLLMVVTVIVTNIWVVKSTEEKVYADTDNLPAHRVALVLGTSHRLVGGGPNPYFHDRIATAAALYKIGKIDHFILSGDNSTMYYNEPVEMRKALIKSGVPDSAITLDYAGLRTLDSVVRSKKIFGQNKLIIITQPFHSYRALFISDYYNIDAVAMVTEEQDLGESLKVRVREYFARTKAVLDLYIFKTDPKFLGKKENISI